MHAGCRCGGQAYRYAPQTGRTEASQGHFSTSHSIYQQQQGGPGWLLEVGLGGCANTNRGHNLRSIRLMLTRPFPPLYLISAELPMLVSERNWIKASQASVRLHSLSIVHFFSGRSLLSFCKGGGEGRGDDLRKWDMLIRAAFVCCSVKTETVVIIASLWLISHYLCLIRQHCWLHIHTHSTQMQAQTTDSFNHACTVVHI